jgi:putative ABC transport system permease protein
LDELESPRRFETLLLLLFATIALALAAFGIHALLRFFVALRTKEMGIRVALGAQRREVIMLTLHQVAYWLCGGALAGIGGALAVTRMLESRLFGVAATDPGTFAAMLIVLLCASAAAAFGPVRNAVRADPMQSLRQE